MHDANKVANRLLEMATEGRKQFTPMQILKLVYIAHGWMLGIYGQALIHDDVQAWQYGPVIPRIYHEVKEFRNSPVTEFLSVRLLDEDFSELEEAVIQLTYDFYGNKSGSQLSSLTHQPGTPWEQTYRPGIFGSVIPNHIIQTHYQRLYAETI